MITFPLSLPGSNKNDNMYFRADMPIKKTSYIYSVGLTT